MWFASRLIIKNIERFSQKNKFSPFIASFFILGILTSVPELAVGLNAIWDNQPAIFAGNLIGASFVLLMFIIPLFGFVANGINLEHELKINVFLLALVVIAAPVFFVLDGVVERREALILIVLYGLLVASIDKRKNLFQSFWMSFAKAQTADWINIGKIIAGFGLIFFASKILVEQTIYFSQFFKISLFVISLVVLSLGTNTPEFVIGIASVIRQKKTVALGDHIGSAAFNSFLFGVFVLIQGAFVVAAQDFLPIFILFATGLTIFFIFMRSKHHLSRWESLIILFFYIVFLALEFSNII